MIKVTAPVRIDISAGWSDADPFRHEFGGAVLNGAINWRVSGILNSGKLCTLLGKVPSNSGLGTSGALRTAYLVTSNPSLIKDRMELINRVNMFENAIVGQRAGFQDQAAAIFGGVNYWEFKANGKIQRKEVEKAKVKHLRERLVLVFAGGRHLSSDIHEIVFRPQNFMKHVEDIDSMKKIAKKMFSNINNERMMGKLISETWDLQRKLHSRIETDNMRKLIKIADGYHLGARATGAGGGGCMIFYCKDNEDKQELMKRFVVHGKKIEGMRVLPFEFDFSGIQVESNIE